jgi:thiamine pyrophosphokinase
MTIERQLTAAMSRDQGEPLTLAQKEALQRAVAKVVALGAQVGVSADQMIQLLQSGLTVGELLEYLAARAGEVA